MQRLKKRLYVFLLTFLLAMNCGPVYAESYNGVNNDDMQMVASLLADLMTRITQQYLNDVTIDELYEGAIRGMTDTLDEYSEYFTENELSYFLQDITAQIFGIGVYLKQNDDGSTMIDSVIKGEPAEAAGLIEGDIIIGVDGVDVSDMEMTKISSMIKERSSEIVRIEIQRDGNKLEFEINKAKISKATAQSAQFDDLLDIAKDRDNSQFGYIAVDQIAENTSNEIARMIEEFKERGVTSVVFDFRGNPGGQLSTAIDICRLLVPEGPVVFTVDKSGKKDTYTSTLAEPPFKKMVVLTDKNTASAAEIIVAAMQDADVATVVGEKTYGKGVVQTLQPLQLGDAIKFTTMEYYRRSGVKVNGVGVKPNILCQTPAFLNYDDERMHNNGSIDELPKAKEILRYLGYETGEIDRLNDELTCEAIRQFQENSGLRQTGICDYETQIALNSKLRAALSKDDIALSEAYKLLWE